MLTGEGLSFMPDRDPCGSLYRAMPPVFSERCQRPFGDLVSHGAEGKMQRRFLGIDRLQEHSDRFVRNARLATIVRFAIMSALTGARSIFGHFSGCHGDRPTQEFGAERAGFDDDHADVERLELVRKGSDKPSSANFAAL